MRKPQIPRLALAASLFVLIGGLLGLSGSRGSAADARVRMISDQASVGPRGGMSPDSDPGLSWAMAFPKFTDPATGKEYQGWIRSVLPLEDGRYLVLADAGDLGDNPAYPTNMLIMILDPSGIHAELMVVYIGGGTPDANIGGAVLTSDGGAVIVGQMNNHPLALKVAIPPAGGSYTVQTPYRHSFTPVSSINALEWIKEFDFGAKKPKNGGRACAVAELGDGGVVIIGHSTYAAWMVKFDPAGNMLWDRVLDLGGSWLSYNAQALKATPDGGFVVLCNGLTKFDAEGNVEWQADYHEVECRECAPRGVRVEITDRGCSPGSVALTGDGGYILAGSTWCGPCGTGSAWILKLDAAGNIVWQKAFANYDDRDVFQTKDGGYLALINDNILLKLDPMGSAEWLRQASTEYPTLVAPSADGGYAFGFPSDRNMNVLHLDANGAISPDCPFIIQGSITKTASFLSRVAPTPVTFRDLDVWIETPGTSIHALTSEALLLCGSRGIRPLFQRDPRSWEK